MAYVSARLADLDETDVVLGALGDATRRGLLRLVRDRELSAGHLAAAFPLISRPAVSQHLRVLCDAGLVSARVDGRRQFFRAQSEALAPVSEFIAEMSPRHHGLPAHQQASRAQGWSHFPGALQQNGTSP